MVGPVAAGLEGCGAAPSASGGPAGVEGAGRASGTLGGVVPSGRGAPGALGSALGSKASDRRGFGGAEPSITTGGAIAAAGAEATADGGAAAGAAAPERSPKRNSTS